MTNWCRCGRRLRGPVDRVGQRWCRTCLCWATPRDRFGDPVVLSPAPHEPRRAARLAPVNRARAERRRAEAFGFQAARCRELPCLACGRPGPSDPAHVRSRGAGGKDRDVIALCRACHRYQHDHGWAALREKHPRMPDPAEAAQAGGWLPLTSSPT